MWILTYREIFSWVGGWKVIETLQMLAIQTTKTSSKRLIQIFIKARNKKQVQKQSKFAQGQYILKQIIFTYMAKCWWISDHHTHMWAFPKLFPHSTQLYIMFLLAIALQFPFTGNKANHFLISVMLFWLNESPQISTAI